jgi:hypothetical protein
VGTSIDIGIWALMQRRVSAVGVSAETSEGRSIHVALQPEADITQVRIRSCRSDHGDTD